MTGMNVVAAWLQADYHKNGAGSMLASIGAGRRIPTVEEVDNLARTHAVDLVAKRLEELRIRTPHIRQKMLRSAVTTRVEPDGRRLWFLVDIHTDFILGVASVIMDRSGEVRCAEPARVYSLDGSKELRTAAEAAASVESCG